MSMQVRIAGAADAGALAEVAAATFALACPPGTKQADIDDFVASNLSRERFDRYLADPARVLLLAELDAAPVGYTMLVLGEPADPDVAAAITLRPPAELSKCYVLPAQHGGGIAAALVERSVAEAAARGAAGVWLGVNQHNARANRFYEKSGFRVVGTKRFRVGAQLHDDFVRERPVPRDGWSHDLPGGS
ncbi:GNAT family N-acetyltransferase [Lysobacter korlensis]|uniref:GNAT family N-acetyltransferase n=1 Tax=Lysobacter korlensis TaxID=553636 RepID=A0ABV6S275_9GAMM